MTKHFREINRICTRGTNFFMLAVIFVSYFLGRLRFSDSTYSLVHSLPVHTEDKINKHKPGNNANNILWFPNTEKFSSAKPLMLAQVRAPLLMSRHRVEALKWTLLKSLVSLLGHTVCSSFLCNHLKWQGLKFKKRLCTNMSLRTINMFNFISIPGSFQEFHFADNKTKEWKD